MAFTSVADVALSPDLYYAKLAQRVINQEVINHFSYNSLINFVSEQLWANGIKDFLVQGLNALVDFDPKAASVEKDWNPDDNYTDKLTKRISTFKKLSYKIPVDELTKAFTTPATLALFVEQRIQAAVKTWDLYFFTEISNFVLKGAVDTTLAVDIAHADKEVANMTNGEMEDALVAVKEQLIDYSYPTPDHLKLLKSVDGIDPVAHKIPYAGDVSNFVMLIDGRFESRLTKLSSKLFNKEDIMIKLVKKAIPFKRIKGYTKAGYGNVLAVIYDVRGFVLAFDIKSLSWTFRSPNLKIITEQYKRVDLGRLHIYPAFNLKIKKAS